VPDGRAANQPDSVTTFSPPIGAPLPGAVVSTSVIFSPASSPAGTCDGEILASAAFCDRVAAVSIRAYAGAP